MGVAVLRVELWSLQHLHQRNIIKMSRQLKRLPEEDEEEEDFEVETEQLDLRHDDPMRSFLPANFGAQEVHQDIDTIYEKFRRTPRKEKKELDSDDDSDDDDDEEEEFPTNHMLTIKAHQKPVSSISLDPSGTRFVYASHDYIMKLYDFPSMSRDHLHAFKAHEPSESHHIHSAVFSPSGKSILVIPATPQAKIYSRDGAEELEFVKGDPYLRDMQIQKDMWRRSQRECGVRARRGCLLLQARIRR